MIQQQPLRLNEKLYLKIILNREIFVLKSKLKKLEQTEKTKNRLILPFAKINKNNLRNVLSIKVIRKEEIQETKIEIETLNVIRAKLLLA